MTTEVTQTILDSPDGPLGNCLQAAVASFLELDLDEVPHFVLHKDWARHLRLFAERRGYDLDCASAISPRTGVAVGPTVRGTHHAVVVENEVMVWDPHPSRAGLLHTDFVFTLTPRS